MGGLLGQKAVGGEDGRAWRETQCPVPSGPAAYMLPVVMGPHTVGKVSQPSFSIKGRSKLGSFSDDLHKARARGQGLTVPRAVSSPGGLSLATVAEGGGLTQDRV